jgi:hypothetical protein
MSKKELNEQERLGLYEQAVGMMSVGADALRGMALLSYKHRKQPEALKVLSEAWGRNSKTMARAVARHSEAFEGEVSRLEADGYLALFALGRLPKKDEVAVHGQWREKTLKAWQVRDLVQEWFELRKASRREKVVYKGCKLLSLALDGVKLEALIQLPEGSLQDVDRWLSTPLTVSLSQERGDAQPA